MVRIATMVTVLLLMASVCWGGERVKMETSLGDITLELNSEKAPLSVANFLKYVDEGAYNQTIFHRVIKDFMIQGGGFGLDQHRKPTGAPIKNEAGNGLKNERGTIAMARTGVVDSATNQFFINLVDNGFLNHTDESARGFGYAVFGKVVEGMEVVDKIAEQPTVNAGGPFANLPQPAVEIIKVTRLQ